jgi:hypothetical protein
MEALTRFYKDLQAIFRFASTLDMYAAGLLRKDWSHSQTNHGLRTAKLSHNLQRVFCIRCWAGVGKETIVGAHPILYAIMIKMAQ